MRFFASSVRLVRSSGNSTNMRVLSWIASRPIAPLVFWMALIFALSSLPGSGTNVEPPLWYVLERKSAHVFEYAVLTFLSFRFLRAVYLRESFMKVVILSGTFSLMYAATDELHQFFVFGRGAKMMDVSIDGIGVIVAVVTLLVLRKWSRKNF